MIPCTLVAILMPELASKWSGHRHPGIKLLTALEILPRKLSGKAVACGVEMD
jgi:hypothetical protein